MSTMLETFDTQMLDYSNSTDVPMQSSSSWMSYEDVMQEDRQFGEEKLDFPLDTDFSVEVEMEPYQNETAEFEMSDDGVHNFEHGQDHELLDVEVADVSHINTPDIVEIPLAADPSFAPTGAYTPVAVEEDMSFVDSPLQRVVDAEIPVSYVAEQEAVEVLHTVEYQAEVTEEAPQDLLQGTEEVEETAQPESFEQDPESEVVDDAHHVEQSAEVAVVELAVDTVLHEPEAAEPNEENQGSNEELNGESTDVAKDPHEISEGVYIDPPPAVQLSVSLLDQLDVYLFNRPQPVHSRSTTPSAHGSDSPESHSIVLLRQLPTLYYEPLSKVFDALRQEEYISRISTLADSELVFDAYDLELVVSEDNLYAREISLHDLNVLHDGLDIPGPLRLRLQTTVPRFILRYHVLQDQISRLNLEPVEHHEESHETPNEAQEYEHSNGALESLPDNEGNVPDENEYPDLPEEEEEAEIDFQTGEDGPEAANTTEEGKTHEDQESVDTNSERAEGEDTVASFPQDAEGRPGSSTPRIVGSVLPSKDAIGNEHKPSEADETLDILHEPRGQEAITDLPLEPVASTSETFSESNPDDTQQLTDEPASNNPSADPEEQEQAWDDSLDADGDPDLTWDVEEEQETASNESVATLSSKTSKRSFHEVEDEDDVVSQASSPGSKRLRTE